MNTTSIGQRAEEAAVDYLRSRGLRIVARNWRTRWCEVDIVARSRWPTTIHIVEVRYRRGGGQGDGLDSITPAKARQLQHAALRWIADHPRDVALQIDVVGVSGRPGQWQIRYVPNAI